tara:strand:- start:430 stop:918 length:489 start_codon:yes stop_codon:yes gene_type:complete
VETNSVRVKSSPTRCPFCHDTCEASGEDVVCHDCLARHHSECWSENGACAACSSATALVAKDVPAPPVPAARVRAPQIRLSESELESLVARQRLGSRLRMGGALVIASALILSLYVLIAPSALPRWVLKAFFMLCASGVTSFALGAWLARDPAPAPRRGEDL